MKKKKRRLKRKIILVFAILILIGAGVGIYCVLNTKKMIFDFSFLNQPARDAKEKIEEEENKQKEKEEQKKKEEEEAALDNGYGKEIPGPTYIKGILIVNKTYSLPDGFATGNDPTALAALRELQKGASNAGYSIPLLSGFRSHQKQIELYNRYVARDGKDAADTYSARPGHSEHETGLTFDIGAVDDNYGETAPGKWLANHAHEYGFIIRYPEGKEDITKYQYEPWHVRYVGKEHAKKIYENQLTLEEYLGIA